VYAGAGLNVQFGGRLTTSLYYHANFGRNDDAEHTVSLNVNWKF
jgi:outer membrane autotransporter protein